MDALTAAAKVDEMLAMIAQGKTLYVCTYTRATKIRQRDIDKWNAIGRPLLKAKGKSMYMGSGKSYLCIDYCGFTFTD